MTLPILGTAKSAKQIDMFLESTASLASALALAFNIQFIFHSNNECKLRI